MNRKKLKIFMFLLIFLLLGQTIQAKGKEQTIVYFYSPTCSSCLQVKGILDQVKKEYFRLKILEYDILDNDNQLLLEKYSHLYKVSKEKRGLVPTVFIGSHSLVGLSEIKIN